MSRKKLSREELEEMLKALRKVPHCAEILNKCGFISDAEVYDYTVRATFKAIAIEKALKELEESE